MLSTEQRLDAIESALNAAANLMDELASSTEIEEKIKQLKIRMDSLKKKAGTIERMSEEARGILRTLK